MLGENWDFPFPHFPFVGVPGEGYPWPWAIVSWLPGEMAIDVPLLATEGAALGRALAQVHVPAPAEAPLNDEQSIPLIDREEKTLQRVELLSRRGGPDGEQLDAVAALALWNAAAGLPEVPRDEWVWSHADLHGGNVLSHAGVFGGIADWGSMAACDPAVDLGFAYSLMPGAGVTAMLARVRGADGARGRRPGRAGASHRACEVRGDRDGGATGDARDGLARARGLGVSALDGRWHFAQPHHADNQHRDAENEEHPARRVEDRGCRRDHERAQRRATAIPCRGAAWTTTPGSAPTMPSTVRTYSTGSESGPAMSMKTSASIASMTASTRIDQRATTSHVLLRSL